MGTMNDEIGTYTVARKILRDTIKNGGGTFDAAGNPDRATQGYFVGLAEGTFRTVPVGYRFAVGAIQRAIKTLRLMWPSALIGTWIYADHIYIDPVVRIMWKEDAIKRGKQNNQIAIWDIRNSREIKL